MGKTVAILLLLLGALAAAPAAEPAENAPTDWVYFDSRETPRGPKLLLTLAGGRKKTVPAAADTVLISYLAERTWGRLPSLSVSLNDSNRVLLRFDLPDGVEKAELILSLGVSKLPPKKPFGIALFGIEKAWEEGAASWEVQPPAGKEPILTFRIERPGQAGEIRVDVTKALGSTHGFMLRAAKPLGRPPVSRSPARPAAPAPAASSGMSVRKALERAKADGRRVLALVEGTNQPGGTTFAGDVLRSTVLVDPDVSELIEARFVQAKLGYFPQSYAMRREIPSDPLRALGTSILSAKAPALVIATASGKHVATLSSIGTFDKDLVLRFLRRGLAPMAGEEDPWKLLGGGDLKAARKRFAALRSGEGKYGLARTAALAGDHETAVKLARPLAAGSGPRAKDARVQLGVSLLRLGRFEESAEVLRKAAKAGGGRTPEALHALGCLLYRDGRRDEARELWQRVADEFGDSPWAGPARSRIQWPGRTAMYETLAAISLPPETSTTERAMDEGAAVAGAVDYLLTHQVPDGSWPDAREGNLASAVTALVAHSLLERVGQLRGARKGRAERALDRAVVWIREVVARENPEHFNSFAAAYILDFQLDRFARDKAARKDAEKAVALLLGGQAENGAWSYDRRFATTWRGGFGGWPKTDKGRVHSMNTGPALVFLARAKRLGLEVDEKALERGQEALLRMRIKPGAFTYTWPDPISWEKEDQSIGRAPVCEQALFALGATGRGDVEKALALFMKYREDLRGPVKLTPGWVMPRGVSSYFYFFSYYHAARAIHDLGGPRAGKRLVSLRGDLLAVVEADGTWVDYLAVGKCYGTAMALRIIHLAEKAGKK